MSDLRTSEILETIEMIDKECLDIRTITMGISLLDCADSDIRRSCEKIEKKILRLAKDLVKTGEEISLTYGIPVVNKRISVTPIALLCAVSGGDPVEYALTLEKCARELGIDFIGGYSALVQKGFSAGDRELIASIPRALAATEHICASVNVGSTKAGINMDAVQMMGKVVRECAEMTAERDSLGAAKLVVLCNAPEDNPFMAGAFHGVGEPDAEIHVGVSGPGVVRAVLAKADKTLPLNEISELVKRTAFKITRMGQLVGSVASAKLGIPAGIVDLSLAPTPAAGDSVAEILEEMGLDSCGAYGTTACLALLNDAVKKGGVMAAQAVGGLSGSFIPVSEDAGMIRAVKNGTLNLEKLEAMTAVCSVGLDMVIVPGDTPAEILSGVIADEAAIGMVNLKTTAVRIIPAIGKKEGDHVNFGGLLGEGDVMHINRTGNAVLIARGGRIPSPMQALKN
jgi:uncharacterized protein (UPF0210 family)